MRTFTFKYGIHPPDSKILTNTKPIEMIYPEAGELMAFPLRQHIGAPCKPLVKIGDNVLMGQKIADSEAPVSSPIHSSVSGVVKAIEPRLSPTGFVVDALIIENDGEYNEDTGIIGWEENAERKDYLKYSKEEYLEIIREAGIVGLGGAGFPTHIKLNPPKEKKIDFIIVNASECEPYLTTDHRVMLEESQRIRNGLKIILRMFPEAQGIIGIETNKMDAIDEMTRVCERDENITIIPLQPKYPQGSEKQLISACTGRKVPSRGLPADAGCIVNNVDTVVAIDRAVRRGRPLIRRIVTVNGGAINRPGNYKALIGMSHRSLIDAIGGFCEEPVKVISGGPMMGNAIFDLDIPIVKVSSALLCFTKREVVIPEEGSCIRCGKCVEHCPIGLVPVKLNEIALKDDEKLFVDNYGMECIECGSCSYICPAKRHLTQSIKTLRRHILSKNKK